MISKDLLSEVLGRKVLWHEFTSQYGFDAIEYEVHDSSQRGNRFQDVINIHELAHKCKEWALGQDEYPIYLSSWVEDDKSYCEIDMENEEKSTVADTEPEAIFKACEWIREQKDNL